MSQQSADGVWADLVGQGAAVRTLKRAVEDDRQGGGHAMSHAWLITGPPGCGRSNAAFAFAAALQCDTGGCGTCNSCRTCLSGAHPDLTWVHIERLSIGVDEIRSLALKAAMSPTTGRRQVILIEDADRVTEAGADALLKALEEPAPRTVWLLCAPTADDVIVTVRSRCRALTLVTPGDDEVAALLVRRDGVAPAMAAHAARIAQGHIGRARLLATNEAVRNNRHQILQIPGRLVGLAACLTAADNLVKAAAERASAVTGELDAAELAQVRQALGMGTQGARPRNTQATLKDLEDQQKARAKRFQRDELDRVITELTTYYRDVLAIQTGAAGPGHGRLINSDMVPQLTRQASAGTPEQTITRIDALLACREALETNVAPLLAMESLMISLAGPADR